MKAQRVYTIEIQTNPLTLEQLQQFGIAGGSFTSNTRSTIGRQIITITDPLTIQFTVTTTMRDSANTADIQIFNLGKSLRELIYKDATDQEGTRFYRGIRFFAGYGTKQTLVFQGNIQYAYSERQGVDWRTVIHAFDGGFNMKYSWSNRSYKDETPISTIINDLSKDMYPVKLKYLSPSASEITLKKAVISGNTWEYMSDLWTSDYGDAFIDREEIYFADTESALQTAVITISAESGLLQTPRKFHARIDVKMLFEPTLRVGQLVDLVSEVTECNGRYKIISINHNGIISDAVNGELITSLVLWGADGKPFNPVILS